MPKLEAIFNIGNFLISVAKEAYRFMIRAALEELESTPKHFVSTIATILGKGKRINEEMEELKLKKAKDGNLSDTDCSGQL